ncbi:MAG: hypothetical protein ACI9YH_000996 [Colwellia sp.]|jgi:hypothetical protein
MKNKNEELTFSEYPYIQSVVNKEGGHIVGSDLEPRYVYTALAGFIFRGAYYQRALPKKAYKKWSKIAKNVNLNKLTFSYFESVFQEIKKALVDGELMLRKHLSEPIRYIDVTHLGEKFNVDKKDAIKLPVNNDNFGDFLSICEDFTCKIRTDGTIAINWLKLKTGQEFVIDEEQSPFYMDGVTLNRETLRQFKYVLLKNNFTVSKNLN